MVQTLLDHGDNPRFLVPLQSLVVLWVVWVVWKTADRGRRTVGGVADAGIFDTGVSSKGEHKLEDRGTT